MPFVLSADVFMLKAPIKGFVCSIIGVICAIVLPDWFENPIKLAPGEWKGSSGNMQAEVTEELVSWSAGGHRGKFTYTWVQTDSEPYRVSFRRGNREFEADIEFNGRDEAVVRPLVFEQLPELAREYIRSRNKAMNRPEDELVFVFRRVRAKKADRHAK